MFFLSAYWTLCWPLPLPASNLHLCSKDHHSKNCPYRDRIQKHQSIKEYNIKILKNAVNRVSTEHATFDRGCPSYKSCLGKERKKHSFIIIKSAQLNLHFKKSATSTAIAHFSSEDIALACIQHASLFNNRVLGLPIQTYQVFVLFPNRHLNM